MIPVLNFKAQYVQNRSLVSHLLEEKARAFPNCVVADLTLGSWVAGSLVTQLASQIRGAEVVFRVRAGAVVSDLGESMSAGIDQEGRGNRTVLDAVAAARKLAELLGQKPAAIVVLVPCYGQPWRWEDRMLLEYLKSLVPSLNLTLGIAGQGTVAWPEGWQVAVSGVPLPLSPVAAKGIVRLLPTAVSPTLARTISEDDTSELIPLSNGWAIVAPENRSDPSHPHSSFGEAAIKTLKAPALQSFLPYAYRHSRLPADAWLYCVEAWKHFAAGYRELAVDYIAAAETAADTPEVKATLTCHKQSMRIAMAQYEDAAHEPDYTATELPAKVKGQLMQTKGWGLVMSGAGAEALPYLREAMELCRPDVENAAYLFLMNITALAEVRCGNFDRALKLELEIEQLIQSLAIPNARLHFVNSINLARLHRYSGDLDGAERLYRRAFSTVEGAKTEIDLVNSNLCLAKVEEGRSNAKGSFLCWLRAALYWVASDCPESINWRVQNLILGKGGVIAVKSIDESYQLVEKLASAFLKTLGKQSELCGTSLATTELRNEPCRFEYVSTAGATPNAERYVGGEGWAVMAGDTAAGARPYGPQYQELVSWLTTWIVMGAGKQGENCYWIDRRNGSEMPLDWSQLVNSAADFNIASLNYEGNAVHLTQAEVGELNLTREVKLNPVVSSIDRTSGTAIAQFRRYFQPYPLTASETAVVQALAETPGIVDLKRRLGAENVEGVIAHLRDLRVLQVFRPFTMSNSADAVPVALSQCA